MTGGWPFIQEGVRLWVREGAVQTLEAMKAWLRNVGPELGCVCVCLSVRERERERKRQRKRERERKRERGRNNDVSGD